MSQKLSQLLIIALVGAAVIVLISLGLESVINNLDEMLVPCQHGTSFNKATASCNCMNTPFKGKYCGECDCAHGQCMVGGTTPKAGSLYGCRCPISTKRFGHKCQLCYAENTTSCKGVCQNGFYGAVCDKTCKSNIVQSDLFASTLSSDALVCRNIRDNGGTCNYCSGHGLCDATGNCDCEKNYFNGPNGGCSQTCAIADNGKICSGHGVCEKIAGVPTCACEYGWRGTDCSVPCPGMEVNGVPCSGHGQCLVNYTGTPTTSCNCNQKFRGDACEIECPGEIVACSGHGTCDDVGVCACNSPAGGVTWVGEACSCSDFITCSGNGNCMGNAQCQCIGNWDGEHCRQCKENYYGSNCQFYCDSDGPPSQDGIGCYGRGTCTVLDFGKREEHVKCECFGEIKVFDDGKITTHFSNYEPLDNCQDCAAGYVPKITAVDQYGLPDGVKVPCELYCSSQTCNSLGDCNEDWGIPEETLCKCHHGPDNRKHLDDNNFCLSCETDWFPEDIRSEHGCSNFCTPDIADTPYSGNFPAICATGVVDCVQCSGHGTCGPRGACLCEDGYTGVECDIQCTGANGLTCSGHGECKVNHLQALMQFEYEFVGNSGALYSCECNPQDPYTDDERKDFRLRVANGEVNGTLENPPVKTFYGEMCEYNCKAPPWAQSEVCNGFGDCEINKIQDPNGGYASCTTDDDCKTNSAIQAILSGSADWSAEKGPFCHKADAPPGCVTSNFTNEDCFYILSLQRPVKARSKECMRDSTCRNFLDGTDWHGWCNDIQTAQKPLPVCESDWESYCTLIKDGQTISPSCVNYVEEAGTTILDFSHANNEHYVYNGENDPEIKLCVNQKYRFNRADTGHTLRVVKDSDCTGCETGTYTSLPTSTVSGWTDSTYGSPSDISFSDPGVYYYVCDAHPNMVGKLTISNFDCPSTYTVTHQLNYCYEKDKSRFPLKVTEAYRADSGYETHDIFATEFEAFARASFLKKNVEMDATQFCDNYLKMFEVEVSHIRTDQLYICNNRIQHTDNCSTEVLALDTVWKPFYVDCDGQQTQYTTLEEAIDNRHEGCIVVEEMVDVDNVTLSNLFAVKSQMGEHCVDNNDCASNECYEGTCCAAGTNTTNIEKCRPKTNLKRYLTGEGQLTSSALCQLYAESEADLTWKYTGNWNSDPAGCFIEPVGNVFYNVVGYSNPCSANDICIRNDGDEATYYEPDGITCLPGATKVNSICTYDGSSCTGVSYWLDNVGCVNQAVGEACFKDTGCQSEVCIGGTCALQESPNCAQVNAAGECIQCIADATLSGTTCTPNGYCTAVVSSGAPDLSLSQAQCEQRANDVGDAFSVSNEAGNPKGCFTQGPGITYYNANTESTSECGNQFGSNCVQKTNNKIFATDEGCVDRPSDALEHEVHTLLEKTCSNAEGVFPVCQYPTDACNINGVSACNDGDSCHTFERDAICSTTGVLNATCKFDIVAEPMSFSTYKCPLPLILPNNTCTGAARDFNWFNYCKDSNVVLFHDNFGVDAIQENEQPAVIHLEEHQRNGDLFSFWVKTNSMIRSSASISVKSGSHEIFRVFLHQGQIQLNAIDTLQSCPVDQSTCNDDFMYNINEWLNLKVSIHYSLTSNSVTLHYNGKTKTDGFLCSGCGSVNSISAIYIEPGTADTHYDEIILSKAIAAPSIQSTCSNFKYCDFDVDYRDKCIDLVTNVRYPHTVEPQHDIIEVCEHRKEMKKYVGLTGPYDIIVEQEMDKLNWTAYCKFKEELNEPITCGSLTYDLLEDYPTECDPWIAPIDTTKACVLANLRVNWQTQCNTIDDAFVTSNMKTYCDPACYEHFINYDQCNVRDTIFSSNSEIPLSVSGCNNVNWLNWCNDVAQNKHPGICSAVECDCSRQEGMTGDSCDLFCNIAADGSPCGIDSGAGICRYTKEQQDQLAQGPFPNELIELIGECECFVSEGTSNCDQECAACVNTTYSYTATPKLLSFGNSGSDHYVYNGENDPEVTVCSNTPITFERSAAGHPLRVVSHADCTECYTGTWFSLPTTSLGGWTDAAHNAPSTVTFTEEGTYYYLCTAHPNMVGKINVRTCGGQIGVCDAARGLCQCLPPWTIEKHVEYETWKGDIRRKLERVYELPTSLLNPPGVEYIEVASGAPDGSVSEAECSALSPYGGAFGPTSGTFPVGCIKTSTTYYYNPDVAGDAGTVCGSSGYKCVKKGGPAYDKAQEDIFRIRLMQGREAFTRYYLDTSTTEDNWKTVYDAWKADPSQYQCAGKPCDFHDTVLLGNLHDSSWNYNYDCAKECPEVDPETKIPCSGHGRCAITGSCVCDPAKVIRGTDAATGSTFQINIFGGETIENSEFMVSKLDQTGYRGENCNLTCPGYHPERQDMTEVCSGHGVCNLEAECQCDIGYTGEICQFTCPGFNEGDLNICAGHGTCGMSQVQIYRDIFAEFDETFYINGVEATRKTNEQPACPLPASKSVGLGYSVINDIGFLDLTKIYMLRETSLCASPSIEPCKKWKDYQNLYYVNRHPFTIDDYTKPTGCIIDGNTIMFNDRTTDVTCENGCLCEGVEEVPGVISIHDYMGKEGGFYQMATGAPDLSVSESECENYGRSTDGIFWYGTLNDATNRPTGCIQINVNQIWYNRPTGTKLCSATNNAHVACIQKSNFAYEPLTEWDGFIFTESGTPTTNSSMQMREYECYFYADKVLLQPYIEVQSGLPSMEVTREECQRYVAENYGSSMYEDADDNTIAKGCVTIMNGNVVQKVVYNTECALCASVACSSTNRCVEKSYERIGSSTKPSGCLKIGDTIKFNFAANSVGCTSSNICIEKEIKQSDPVVIYHKQIGFNYSENVGRYQTGDLVWTGKYLFEEVSSGTPDLSVSSDQCHEYALQHGYGWSPGYTNPVNPSGCFRQSSTVYFGAYSDGSECGNVHGSICVQGGEKEYVSNVIAGPANESVIIDICDKDPDCGGYYAIIPDTPGTYMAVSKFNNALVEDRTEAYRLVGLETECTGELNKVIHEKITGKPDMNKGSITNAECRLIAERAGKEYSTDYYSGDPTGCFLFTDGKIYFNQQSTTVECSASKLCYETITRRKREIGAEFYEVDFGMPDGSATQEDCARYAAGNGIPLSMDDTTGNPAGCFAQGNAVYYNVNMDSPISCGVYSLSNCVRKREVFFTPYTPTNKDVDLNSCAEVCRITDQCAFYTVETNKCYMYDGCTELATGTDEIYQLQSPEDGRVFMHMTKLPPTLCMSENGARFDDKTQAPVIRTINILTANCTGDQIWSAFANKCVDFSYNPRFDATFFLDKGTTQEKQLPVQCQITGNNTARCALCTCFSDFIYGQWAGFTCDTCNVGFGNSQCRQICPGFDGDNMASMCGGNGACLFGSEVNAENGERLFQQANCVCGQDNQYAERQPESEIYSTYPSTGGIAGDGSIVGYYYFTPVPYTINYPSRFDAQNACNRFNDLDNIDRGGFCFGVYRKYISVEAVSPEVFLAMGFVGGSYTLYGKYWEKEAISGFSRFYNFKRLELYNALEGLPVAKDCKDILSIRSDGFDTCNHFATEDIDPSCTTCEEGWTGKNCRTVCSKCLLGGGCAGVPSESTSSACVCPAGAGALWEHQCCPTGFMVADKTTWQGKSQSDVNAIRLSLTYDSSTTNELDASYYCKTCPGISHEDWMSPDALYKVCSGPTRGTCQPVPGKLELACDCKMNSVTKNRWLGRACACDESINIPYSTDSMTAESTDYGCLLPTNGNGMCPSGSTVNLFFNPPKIYGQDATYIVGETYGSPFLGVFAGQTFAIKKVICSQSSPCHTGEGHCENDEECAGTLKCFIRNDGEEKLSFNAEKITYDMNYCYHDDETMVGCHPTDFENYLATREYHKQFYYDAANAEFKQPALGEYVPYSQDANLAMIIHQQAFTCPKGRYGLTVPDRVNYGNGQSGHTGGTQVQVYSGSSDNPGASEDQLKRCFEACLNQRSPISGTWDFIAKSFDIKNDGQCYCNAASQATGGVGLVSGYMTYDIITEGEWNVCEKCQPGKFQSTKGNVAWVKLYSGYNTNSISREECKTFAAWHGYTMAADSYNNCGAAKGCFLYSSTVYYNGCGSPTRNCVPDSSYKFCLGYGGGLGLAKTDKHPNCENCPAGKFGGPVGSWAADLCEVCEPGTKQNSAGTGCENCPAGKYELGGLCLQCPNGQFSAEKHPGTVEQPCNNCPAGKDTNGQIETAGTSDAVCRFCPAGKANGIAGRDCVDCGVGKFTSTTGKTSCDNCGIQKFANVPGMSACKTCGVDSPYAGLYGHTNNRDTCVQCNLGEYVSTTTGVCTDCPKGYEQPLNNYQTGCKICDAGEYAPNVGTGSCTSCELGKYQSESGKDTCIDCQSGRYANVRGHSNCKECPSGQYQNSVAQSGCKSCAKGTYTSTTGQSQCLGCNTHTFQDQTGQTSCKNCPGGKYGNNNPKTSSNACSACPSGRYSGGGTACVYCPAGKYNSQTGQTSCPDCPDGHYNTGSGNTACTAGCQAKEGTTACLGQTCACYRNRGISSGTCGSFLDYGLYDTKSECIQTCIAKYCTGSGGACGTVWDSCGAYSSSTSCSSSTSYTSGQYMWTNSPWCPFGSSGGCCKYSQSCWGCGCQVGNGLFGYWWESRSCSGGSVNYGDCGSAAYCFWGCCKSDGTDAGTTTYTWCSYQCPYSEGHCFNYQNFKHYWNWADC